MCYIELLEMKNLFITLLNLIFTFAGQRNSRTFQNQCIKYISKQNRLNYDKWK